MSDEGIALTRAELAQVTGYKQPRRMAQWLSAHAWVFEPPARRSDVPVVGRAYCLARLSGELTENRRTKPNFGALPHARRKSQAGRPAV